MEARMKRELEKRCMSEIIKESTNGDLLETDLLIRVQNRSSPKPVAMQFGDSDIINLGLISGDLATVIEKVLNQQEAYKGDAKDAQMIDGLETDCEDEDEQGKETVTVSREAIKGDSVPMDAGEQGDVSKIVNPEAVKEESTPMEAGGGDYEKFEEDLRAESMRYVWVSKLPFLRYIPKVAGQKP